MYNTLLTAALAATAAYASPLQRRCDNSTSNSTSGAGLNTYAKAAGLQYFGTASDIPGPEQQDAAYQAVLRNNSEFGQLTPANYMKWEYVEPEQGVFNYTGGDVILDTAEADDQIVRCHNLVWYNQLPDWSKPFPVCTSGF